MTTASSAAELLHSPHALCGECPLWSAATGSLLWLDIPRGLIHRYSLADGPAEPFDVGQPIGCLSLRRDGGLLMGLASGFALADDVTAPRDVFAPLQHPAPGMKLNDGSADPQGRFWAGSSSLTAETPWLGRLYRVDPDGAVSVVLEEVGMSNGIGWSPDGSTMYYVDSRRQSLDAFDFDAGTGSVSGRRELLSIPRSRGIPDGLAVDADGAIWLAIYGSGTVVRLTPDGREDRAVSIPADQATSCAFGGPGLRTLFITSATEDFTEHDFEEQPHAGGLFAIELDVPGLPVTPFGGAPETVALAATNQEDV